MCYNKDGKKNIKDDRREYLLLGKNNTKKVRRYFKSAEMSWLSMRCRTHKNTLAEGGEP